MVLFVFSEKISHFLFSNLHFGMNYSSNLSMVDHVVELQAHFLA